ncbi:Sir2 family NAD-dependent protein deacetylase [Pedobacter sp. UC225_65]|uniref:Sir2 family NAD-dependent protein deacetylase n=1 Tax=Pedobacter sp. UC225_65 TaxID=3350173 RepID=UPI003672FAE4
MGERCELGSQLRPHVVWFGEAVPEIETAAAICATADLFMLVGTSLAVYPAAGLIDFVPNQTPKYIIDPKIPSVDRYKNVIKIEKSATAGLEEVAAILKS